VAAVHGCQSLIPARQPDLDLPYGDGLEGMEAPDADGAALGDHPSVDDQFVVRDVLAPGQVLAQFQVVDRDRFGESGERPGAGVRQLARDRCGESAGYFVGEVEEPGAVGVVDPAPPARANVEQQARTEADRVVSDGQQLVAALVEVVGLPEPVGPDGHVTFRWGVSAAGGVTDA
jgi:hypothetical protein